MTNVLIAAFLVPALLLSPTCVQEPRPDGGVQIHVDERCRIYTQDRASETESYSRPGFHNDNDICRVESAHKSKHWEGMVENGIVKRTQVLVVERTFVLHDPTDLPVTFVVEQSLPKGWHVDSFPQPKRVEDSVAVFEVIAKAGQTIKLHVGIRR